MNKLQAVRKEKNLTQKQLAEALGISSSYYSRLENGKLRMSLSAAQKIAQALGVTMDDIFMPGNLEDTGEHLA